MASSRSNCCRPSPTITSICCAIRRAAPGVVDPARPHRCWRAWPARPQARLVLITHHHADHIGGLAEVKAATGCRAVGPRADAARIPGLDVLVVDGDEVAFGTLPAAVLATPGHTSGHISYWFPEAEALFCGDTLFALGCGRLFEGDAAHHVALAEQAHGAARRDPGLLRPRVHAEQRPLRAGPSSRTTRTCASAPPRSRPRAPGASHDPDHDRPGEGDQPVPARGRPGPAPAAGAGDASDAEVFGEIRRRKDRACLEPAVRRPAGAVSCR